MTNKYDPNLPSTEPNWTDLSKAFTSKLLFFPLLSNIIFAYNVQFAIVPVYSTMENNSPNRLKKLNLFGMITTFTATTIIAICGFLTTPQQDPPVLIIFREPFQSSDYLMTLGKLLISMSIIGEYSVTFNSLRLSFFQLLRNNETFSNKE